MPVTFLGGSLIRVCTGSFGNVFGGVNLENNKVGQIFLRQHKGGHEPYLVPVTIFSEGACLRACTFAMLPVHLP